VTKVAERESRTNALRREFVVEGEARSGAYPEAVWDTLADLRAHLIWAGERAGAHSRLVSIDAPDGLANVGTEFESEGIDPMGRFSDRSVVTEAIRPSSFEFVTEARLTTKKAQVVDWTNVHRYEVWSDGDGSRVRYVIRVTRVSALPGVLVAMRLPVVSGLMRKAMASGARATAQRVAAFAEERAHAIGT
jgi:hypothetical protein